MFSFIEDQNAFWIQDMTRSFMQNTDVNIIVVEWKIAARFPYNQAISNIRIVGKFSLYSIQKSSSEMDMEPFPTSYT